jgi:hypothetical protein
MLKTEKLCCLFHVYECLIGNALIVIAQEELQLYRTGNQNVSVCTSHKSGSARTRLKETHLIPFYTISLVKMKMHVLVDTSDKISGIDKRLRIPSQQDSRRLSYYCQENYS